MNSIIALLEWNVLLWIVTSVVNSSVGELFSSESHHGNDAADQSRSTESPNSNRVPIRYEIQMPGVQPAQEDDYLCKAWKVPEEELYIVKFEALANGATVHHLVLTGCLAAASDSYWRNCYEACHNGQILYAWARNAPPFDLPDDVGFRIGNGTSVKYLVIQVHYTKPFTDALQKDFSGVSISVTEQRQKYVAGIFLLVVNSLLIPAHAQKFHGDVSCYFDADAVLHPFAFRTHAHSLGRVISGYMFNGSWHLLGKGDPRWPQAFWPITEQYTIKKDDGLVARCTYDASGSDKDTKIGSTHEDEMCNFYLMYYTDPSTGASFYSCRDNREPALLDQIPADSDVTLPPNPALDDIAEGNSYEGKPLDFVNTAVSNSSGSLRRSEDYAVDDSYLLKEDPARPSYDAPLLENTHRGRWLSSHGQGNQGNQRMQGNQYAQWKQRSQHAPGSKYVQQNLDEPAKEDDEEEVMEQGYRNQHPYADPAEDQNPIVDHQWDSSPSISTDPSPATIAVVTATATPSTVASMQLIAGVVESVIRNSKSKLETVDAWTKKMESGGLTLGQVSSVAVGTGDADVYIFHRGSRVWNKGSFDALNNLREKDKGPIKEKTLVQLNASSGDVLRQWADGIFYMPHGLHIDGEGNFWVTDVALHQVMKFSRLWPTSDPPSTKPDLVLGVRFEPGSDESHFCKPTDVAVLHSGEFFVSDGYCNSRILKFSKDGKLLKQWGEHSSSVLADGFPPPSTFDLPHSITVLESRREVCVADRENVRVQCFAFDGTFLRQIHPTEFKPRLFAVTYSEVTGNLYSISGPSVLDSKAQLQGTTISMEDGKLLGTWQPKTSFVHPHDVAVSRDGRFIYVAEIGPNRIWQFKIISNATSFHQSVKKAGALYHPISNGDEDNEMEDSAVDKAETYFGATVIIGGLIIVPIIIMIVVLTFLRLRRRGKQAMASSRSHNRRFNLGSLLAGSRSSDFVARDDEQRLELKHLQSDSEVEEFSSVPQQNA